MLVEAIVASAKRTLISVNVPEVVIASHLLVVDNPIIDGSDVPTFEENASALNLEAEVVAGANQIGAYTPAFPTGYKT